MMFSLTEEIQQPRSNQPETQQARSPKSKMPKKADSSFSNIALVGGGAYGQVYRARVANSSDVVAVKRVPKTNIEKSLEYDQILLEVEVGKRAATNKSQHLVPLFACYMNDSCLVLVMKLFSNGSLLDLLKNNCIPSQKHIVRNWASQAIAGLSEVHAWHYIHRDVKPENLLLCDDGRLKIADFGLVLKVLKPGEVKQYAGTPAYSAPEVVIAKIPQYESDFYSLGMTLFHIITGELPYQVCSNFYDSAFEKIFEKNAKIDWDSIKLEEAERELLECALDPDYNKRTQLVLQELEYFRGVDFKKTHLLPSYQVDSPVRSDQSNKTPKVADAGEVVGISKTINTFPNIPKSDFDFGDEKSMAKDFYYSSISN